MELNTSKEACNAHTTLILVTVWVAYITAKYLLVHIVTGVNGTVIFFYTAVIVNFVDALVCIFCMCVLYVCGCLYALVHMYRICVYTYVIFVYIHVYMALVCVIMCVWSP